jgi:hypothetical protein
MIIGKVGLATLRQETNDLRLDQNTPHNLFLTNDPGLEASLIIHYEYPVFEKMFIVFLPEVSYLSFENMKIVENYEQTVHSDYDINLGIIDWKAKVYLSYHFGWVETFGGFVYQDFMKNIAFNGTTTDSFNNQTYVERDMVFGQNLIFAGALGFRFIVDENKYLTIRSIFSEGYAIYGSVMFNL